MPATSEAEVDAIAATPPRPDVRRMNHPPPAVVAAGDLPFAFSAAGGDTAAALAAGRPVAGQAHEGRPAIASAAAAEELAAVVVDVRLAVPRARGALLEPRGPVVAPVTFGPARVMGGRTGVADRRSGKEGVA